MERCLLLELGITVRDRGIEPDATKGGPGPLRGVGVLSRPSGRQWCGRIPSHPDSVHRTTPVPGTWRSSAIAGSPGIGALLFALYEVFLFRLVVGLAAWPV